MRAKRDCKTRLPNRNEEDNKIANHVTLIVQHYAPVSIAIDQTGYDGLATVIWKFLDGTKRPNEVCSFFSSE